MKYKELPTDTEVSSWFEENIGAKNDCSASSAVYKFRLYLKDYLLTNETPAQPTPVKGDAEDDIDKIWYDALEAAYVKYSKECDLAESWQPAIDYLKTKFTPIKAGDDVLSAKEIMETINPKEGWAWSSKMIEQVAEQYASQFAAPQAVKWVQAKAFEALVISVEGWQLISDNGNLKVLYDTFKETLQSILDEGSTDKKTK